MRWVLKVGFVIEGEFEQAVAAVKIKFLADVKPMVIHCFSTDMQQVGNLLAGSIFGNQL
jgi:hypothetical protein